MGAAFSNGLAFGADLQAAHKAHQQKLADLELASKIGQANDNIANFQQKLGQFAPGSTEHAQAMQGLQSALQERNDLFHPAKNPGALQKFGHMLLSHVRSQGTPVNPPAVPEMKLPGYIPPTNGTGAGSFTLPAGDGVSIPGTAAMRPEAPLSPQQLKTQAEANLIASAAPTPPPGSLTPEEEHKAELIKAGLEPKAVAPSTKAPAALNPKNIVMGGEDGKTPGYYEADGKFVPLEGHYTPPPPKPAPHSTAALQTYIRTAYGDNPTIEQMEEGIRRFKQLQTPDTVSSHEAPFYDRQGNLHIITEHSTSHKSFGGGSRGGGASASAGSSSGSRSTRKSASDSSAGRVIPGLGKNTPAQTKAENSLTDATKLRSLADDAWAHPSAVKDKQLALQIIRGSAGRVNMQEYDILTRRAGIANSLQAWVNKATTGELPMNIRKQLVDAVHSNYKAAQDARDAAYAPPESSTPGDLKSKAKANTQPKNEKDPLGILE